MNTEIIQAFNTSIDEAFSRDGEYVYIPINAAINIVEMLKDHEAVKPVKEHATVMNTLACGVCRERVACWSVDYKGEISTYLLKANYCPRCGRKVKWDD